jgi:hypothetical protein
MAKESSPRLFNALKIGIPLTANATAPFMKFVLVLNGVLSYTGFNGIDQWWIPNQAGEWELVVANS